MGGAWSDRLMARRFRIQPVERDGRPVHRVTERITAGWLVRGIFSTPRKAKLLIRVLGGEGRLIDVDEHMRWKEYA